MAGEWVKTVLGELVEAGDAHLQTGPFGTTLKAAEYSAEGVPLISVGEVRQGHFEVGDKTPRISIETTKRLPKFLLEIGDIVFGRKGGIDRNAIVRPQQRGWFLGSDGIRLRLSEKYNSLFFSYQMRSPATRAWLLQHCEGTTMPSLNQQILGRVPIVLPPLPEQKAIAHILGTLDDKIELNRRVNETLEAIAQAIFKSWFVDFDPVRAKASGEAPESICRRLGLTPDLLGLFPDRLVDSELGEIPEGWEVRAVGDLAKVVKGKSYKSNELAPSKTALVTLKSFNRGGGYRLDGLKEYTGSYKQEQEVFAGDLIVAYTDVTQAADVIGKPALVISDDAYEHLVISLDVALVRPVRDEYRVYLYGVMSGVKFQQHTRAHTTGTTVLHLASNAVPGFKFIFPGDALVNFYATFASPTFASIDEHVAEGRTLASLRDTLLPKLLSGELRVPVTGAL